MAEFKIICDDYILMHIYIRNTFKASHNLFMTNILCPDVVESLLRKKSSLLDDDLWPHLYVTTAVILIKYGKYTAEMLSMTTKEDLREGTHNLLENYCSARLVPPITSLAVKRKPFDVFPESS